MDQRPFDSPWQTLRRFADYRGRSTRSELLYFCLLMIVATFVVDFTTAFTHYDDYSLIELVLAAGLVPLVPLLMRRLHDQGRSGWWLLAGLPALALQAIAWWQFQSGDFAALFDGRSMLLGAVAGLSTAAIIVLAFVPGERSENQYGPNPRAGAPGEAG